MRPPVSIVTCVYNRQAFLAQTIESVLAQTYSSFEYLIWDDGSTDQSLAIARSYAAKDSRIQVIAASHQGIAPSLRAAVAMTVGQYIGWVDSDDLLAPTALEETTKVLDHQPAIGWVYSNYELVDSKGQTLPLPAQYRKPFSYMRLLVEFTTFHFRLLRREVYEAAGGINPEFERACDYDLCLRLSETANLQHVPSSLYFYRRHNENVTNNRPKQSYWSYLACHNALYRRGLAASHELKLGDDYVFTLCPKQTPSSSSNSWMSSIETLEWIEQFIVSQASKTVIALGSGKPTLLLAKLQQQGAIAQSLTLEHDAYYHQHIIQQLQAENLQDHTQVWHCPLQVQQIQDEPHLWYDLSQFSSFSVDLILIDGPSHNTGTLARYPALHFLREFIQPGTWIILGNYHRSLEKDMVNRWLKELPQLQLVETLSIDAGLALMQFAA